MNDLRELYEEVILDHNRNPRYFQELEHPNCQASGYNPICGDELTIFLEVEDGRIKDAGFQGVGCAISVASASLMLESLKGKPVEEAERLFQGVHTQLTEENEEVEGGNTDLGKLEVLKGVRAYPMRVKCATLAWHTLHAALTNETTTISTE